MRRLVNRLTLFPLFGLLVVAPSQEAFGHATGLFQQSTQGPRDARSGAGSEDDVRALEPGKPHRRELAGGQRHAYRIRLGADQFLKAVVEQDGVDVAARVFGPDGEEILEVDSEIRSHGQETVSLVGEVAGDYRLIVAPKQRGATSGRYEIRIAELRIATNDYRELQEARKLIKKGLEPQRAGKYDEAIPLIARALEIRERILGPDHRDVASTINVLANLYYYKGDYAKAEPLYQRALDIREKALGPEHPQVASSLNNLANLYIDRGAYVKAEPLHQRALGIREKSLGPEHPDVAESLNNLGIIYSIRGEYAKAEPLYQRALTIREKAEGPEHPNVADVLNNLADLFRYRGEYAKAETRYQRALVIREKALGPEHPDVARVLNNLAVLYRERGEYAKAEQLHQRALTIWEKAFGPEHPDVAQSLNGLANLYRERGEYAKAEPLFQRALAVLEKAKGAQHPSLAESFNDLAVLCAAKGAIAQAVAFQSRANAISEHNLALNLAALSERQKLAYLATISEQTERTISLHLRHAPNDPAARSLAVALILQRKARALDATSESLNALRSRFNAEDRALLDRLTDARSQIARLILDGPRRMTADQYRGRVKTLEEQAEKFEAEISLRSDEFRAQSLPITLEAVRAAIPADAALIEFASYRPFNPKAAKDDDAYGRTRYVAYVLRRQGEIQWKELGEAKAIDEAVARLRKALRDPKRADVSRLARVVDDKVMRPVRTLLGAIPGGTRRLLIAPDGSLNLIPFAALVDERGQYLVERYTISYLTSGRDLLRLQLAPRSSNAPLIVANPAFGRVETLAARAGQGSGDSQSGDQAWGQIDPDMVFFQSLPGTEHEALAIKAVLTEASVLLREQATETALKRSKAPRVLHIATHGFFLGDQEAPPMETRSPPSDDQLRLPMRLSKWASKVENPLLRSGLALAGANERRGGDDDGVLTAMEVASLDLWGTRLVALSGCDTGVGEVRNGEGVYGLRRALVLAGSETQVLSLWPVLDKETRNLMAGYYRRLLKGEGRGEALRQIQLGMLKDAKLRHPYYWGSFIQAGEWANLDGRR